MSYSGVGRVVPSMVAVKTNASSQNAIRRGTPGLPPSATGWSRQSTHGWSGTRLRVCVVAMVRIASRPGLSTPGSPMLAGTQSLVIVASGHPCPLLARLAQFPLAAIHAARPPDRGQGATGWHRDVDLIVTPTCSAGAPSLAVLDAIVEEATSGHLGPVHTQY